MENFILFKQQIADLVPKPPARQLSADPQAYSLYGFTFSNNDLLSLDEHGSPSN